MLSKLAPAALRIGSHLRKIWRVWAQMSPRPTICRLSSVAVVPEMNSRFPTRIAGEKVSLSDQRPGVTAS